MDSDGNELGIISFQDAFRKSQYKNLDMVVLSDTTTPPVVKILDYGKFLYNKNKKNRGNKKSSTKSKEIKLHVNISSGDLDTKVNNAKNFLEKGNRIKFSLKFRGREIVHAELGRELMQKVVEKLKDYATIDGRVISSGKNVFVQLVPKK